MPKQSSEKGKCLKPWMMAAAAAAAEADAVKNTPLLPSSPSPPTAHGTKGNHTHPKSMHPHKKGPNSSNTNNDTHPAVRSVDEQHTLLMNKFAEEECILLPQLLQEKQECKEAIARLRPNQMEEYLTLCDRIREISEKIKTAKNRKKEYLLDNAAYIFHYFEEKKNISLGSAAAANSSLDDSTREKQKSLCAFFKIKTAAPENSQQQTSAANDDLALSREDTSESVLGNPKYRLSQQQYWANVNREIINTDEYMVSSDTCERCGRGELITQEDEGAFICNHCGTMVQYIIDNEKPSYKEPPGEVSYTAYVRLNHFKEILSQFQAKETTQIPDDVIEAVRERIKKERIDDIRQITYLKTRDILRKLGYNKYFEHVQYINHKFGIQPPVMPEELVEVLCVLFIEIQGPWAMHCPATRINFFNYGYTLYQLCRLVGADEYCKWIPLLKDPIKTMEQDEIWKKVCNELGWKFFPTPRT